MRRGSCSRRYSHSSPMRDIHAGARLTWPVMKSRLPPTPIATAGPIRSEKRSIQTPAWERRKPPAPDRGWPLASAPASALNCQRFHRGRRSGSRCRQFGHRTRGRAFPQPLRRRQACPQGGTHATGALPPAEPTGAPDPNLRPSPAMVSPGGARPTGAAFHRPDTGRHASTPAEVGVALRLHHVIHIGAEDCAPVSPIDQLGNLVQRLGERDRIDFEVTDLHSPATHVCLCATAEVRRTRGRIA